MNPFAEHDLNQQDYEQLLTAEQVNGKDGNSLQFPLDTNGRPIQGTTQSYPATISPFANKDFFGPAGFVSMLVAQAIVRKAVLPPGTNFNKGQFVIVTAVGGSTRLCQVNDVTSTFTEYRLELDDKNEGA